MEIEVFESFDKWKKYLGTSVLAAKKTGLSEDKVVVVAKMLGELLAKKVDPANREQRLLKELWDVGSEEDKKVLAKLITRMVEEEMER
ncbi:DUF3243 domain-containing protein [Natranaerofaba carboxydovora]|uniref:DUF3243 domain-containing protein n=1 Tax=Natranaerofaba carboxydovora TaxID=2742683 RepID=UPI001F13EBA3|nr:DUF3243 domain-containing protein [Natranaerofaba carboxydovora]UMZ75330.1 hypothetical protein ACONDI_02953 [Natranaerofaba carboxydovora]